jgi:DNA-binding beta-propeller fold protein YncE
LISIKRRRLIIAAAIVTVLLASAAGVLAISFITKWGTTGLANGEFSTPTGIGVDAAGNVYVAEGNGNRVQKFDNNGAFLLKFGIPGDVPGGFVSPSGVAVDSAGNIYVADAFEDKVSKFNSAGTFQLRWGSSGSGNGSFLNPSGVAVDSSNNIYVSDSNNHRIQKFTSGGVFIAKWGSSGSLDGQFNSPQGLAIDSSDNVYVADTGNNRIQKFTSGGVFLTKWGTAGSGNSEFMSPGGVSADSLGNVFVADSGNNRIQSFSSAGTFQEAFGTSGTGDGQFSGPQDVAADPAGNIFVADTGNDRVQKLGTAPVVVVVVADAGPDQMVECAGSLTPVTLNGTASTGGGTLTYTWEEGATTLGTGATLMVSLPTGVHTITLTVESSGGGSDEDTVMITIADNIAPTLTLNGPNPMTVECHTGFIDPGATANDGCAGDLTSSITVSGTVNPDVVGNYTLTYKVSDGTHTTSVDRSVQVVDTTPPTITVNGANPMTVECHTSFSDPGATATDGCAGSVPVNASGTVNVNVPGTYMINYTASDPSGNPAVSKTRTVNVVDTITPTINLSVSTLSMWPPNHEYQTFNVSDFVSSVTDGCDTSLGVSSVVISQVTSDELENSGGDGNTSNDIVIAANCKSVQLRAERDGPGDGRVYTITFEVRDGSGNVGTATARVLVPKSQGSGPAIDSGPHYTVNGSCP